MRRGSFLAVLMSTRLRQTRSSRVRCRHSARSLAASLGHPMHFSFSPTCSCSSSATRRSPHTSYLACMNQTALQTRCARRISVPHRIGAPICRSPVCRACMTFVSQVRALSSPSRWIVRCVVHRPSRRSSCAALSMPCLMHTAHTSHSFSGVCGRRRPYFVLAGMRWPLVRTSHIHHAVPSRCCGRSSRARSTKALRTVTDSS